MSYRTGLIADWELQADADDSHTNALDLTENTFGSGSFDYNSDGVLLTSTGAPGFDSNWLNRADHALLEPNSVNFFGMAEVFFAEKNTDPVGQVVIQKSPVGGTSTTGYGVSYTPSNDRIIFYIITTDGYFFVHTPMPSDPTLARHFVFFWIDFGAGTINIQRDAEAPASQAFTGDLSDSAHNFYVGSNEGTAENLLGRLRRLRLWKGECVLDDVPGMIAWLYNSASGRTYADIIALGGSAECGEAPEPEPDCPDEPPAGAAGQRALRFRCYDFPIGFKPVSDPQRLVLGYAKSPRTAGARVTTGTLDGKRIHIRGNVIDGPFDRSAWRPRMDTLRWALAQGPGNLYLWTDRFYRLMQCEEMPEEYGDVGWNRMAELNLVFTGPEPFMCETTLNSDEWLTPSGTHSIVTGGNAPAPPTFHFTVGGSGAETIDFTLENDTTAASFRIAGDVNAGDVVVVDCQPYVSVTIAGEDRMDLFEGEFLSLLPAQENVLSITVADGTLTSLVTEYRNRWR